MATNENKYGVDFTFRICDAETNTDENWASILNKSQSFLNTTGNSSDSEEDEDEEHRLTKKKRYLQPVFTLI